MLDIFYKMCELLEEQVELSKKMERHLYSLTLPPDMLQWSKDIKKKRYDKK